MSRFSIAFRPGPDLFRQGLDPLLLLRDLSAIGEVIDLCLDDSRLPAFEHLDPETCYLAWTLQLETDRPLSAIQDLFAFFEDASDIVIAPAAGPTASSPEVGERPQETPAAPPLARDERRPAAARGVIGGSESTTIRVSTEKVDSLVNLVGELVISQSMVAQALHDFTPAKLPLLLVAAGEMERNTRELQQRVMSIRMVPIGMVFSRFSRLVHDMARTIGKQVTLEISGSDTELDKSVVEHLADPLTHLIRNAIDHGLESAEQRAAAGKPVEGTIRLHAVHEGGNIVVEVSDDGRGLDRTRIRDKAIASGLVRADEPIADDDINGLIFRAGFSTAETVSDLSGRGVGLDVVKRNIDALNGSIGIVTAPGRGTSFRIKLPLTLAILDGLQLAVGPDIYVVPLLGINGSFRPRPSEVKSVFGHGEVVTLRGETLPLYRLHRLLNTIPRETAATAGLVVIVEHHGRRCGLLVDELLGQSQVVIKNLEANYRKVEGIMGATILGDGRVALILDVPELLTIAERADRAA